MLIRYIKNEKGIALILLALSIIVLFGFGALAVDIGHMYNVKNQLQVAADSAALAAAAKLTYSDDLVQQAARDEAVRVAARNNADVAYSSTVPTAPEGSPIPVTLQSNDANNPDGDIVTGYWDGTDFHPNSVPSGKFTNAVKVVARRTGGIPEQPPVQSMFAKVLNLLGSNFNFTQISADAIASNDLPPLVTPIIVNEYWRETRTADSGTTPYGIDQVYPESFVRQTNLPIPPSTTGTTSRLWKNTFSIMGQAANPNIGKPYADNPNGFVCMDYRFERYDQASPGHNVVPGNTDCSNCTTLFTAVPTLNDATLKKDALAYLDSGYPYDRILPTAANESYNAAWPSPPAYNIDCPYASLVYFEGGGAADVPTYDVGRRLICMVYDGTHEGTGNGKLMEIVGYTVLEVDGYDNGMNPPNDLWSIYDPNHPNPDDVYAHNRTVLSPKHGGSMYAHAVSDIYQPNAGESSCNFIARLRSEIKKMGSGGVHLVGRNEPYGVATH